MGEVEVEVGTWIVVKANIVTIVLHIEIGKVFISVSVGVSCPARKITSFDAEIIGAAVLVAGLLGIWMAF